MNQSSKLGKHVAKRSFAVGSSAMIAAALIACGTPGTTTSVVAEPSQHSAGDTGALVIHYHRFDGNADQASLWTWDPHEQFTPEDNEVFPSGESEFGVYFKLNLADYGVSADDPRDIGFIPRLRQDWNFKDGNDRIWNPRLGNEIWLIGNDPVIYTERPDTSPRVALAWIDSSNSLIAQLSHPLDSSDITPANFSVREESTGDEFPATSVRRHRAAGTDAFFVRMVVDGEIDVTASDYFVLAEGYQEQRATPRRVLDDADIFYSDEPMGASYSPDSTTFRIFSPLATEASVVLYDNPTGNAGRRVVAMNRHSNGVWETTVEGDLEGKHYRLLVDSHQFGQREVNDPWATNTTGFDGHARITDVRSLDPDGFRPITRPAYGDNWTDAVIYEIHVRDFTIDPNSGVDSDLRGKYLGFVQEGTVLEGFDDISTGLDHLKEMGITHVQILPFQDFDNNENSPTYNWGYMTAFFNAPEGWFASDHRTEARVRELKEMIHQIKEAGLGVILDVVYNHTGVQNTFEEVSPTYFHRLRDDGSFWNGSGTGNEFRSEAPMGRKFIIDSCRFWVEEYGVDGFRFDLMGLIDLETMEQLRDELHAIDPSIMLYGEPWAATGPDGSGLDRLTWKDAVSGTGIGAFNDHFRNAIKGPPDGPEPGYVQDGRNRGGVVAGIAGSIDDWAANPIESINYVTCHDNLTLWDKYLESMPDLDDAEYRKMQKLAHGILSVSQGILFVHAGAEMARTKGGNHNSYNAGDDVNMIDWQRKVEFADVVDYYRGMIEFRRNHPVFRLPMAEDVRARLRFHDDILPAPQTIVFTLDGSDLKGESLETVGVFINPLPRDLEFDTSAVEGGHVFVHGADAGTESLGIAEATTVVPARSMTVIGIRNQ